jgi:hypothetical protein
MIGDQMQPEADATVPPESDVETATEQVDSDRLARAALCRLVEPGDMLLARWLERLGAAGLLRDLRKGAGSADLPDSWRARLAAVHPERDLDAFRRGPLTCGFSHIGRSAALVWHGLPRSRWV